MNQQNRSVVDKFAGWVKHSVSMKLFTIGILILILMIPLSRVKQLIYERQGRKMEATSEIGRLWGGPQSISGPILTIPYIQNERVWNNTQKEYEFVEVRHEAHFLPANLNIRGEIKPDIRYRGIFEVPVYQSEIVINGHFIFPSFEDWKIENERIQWDEVMVSFGLSDLRSLQDNVILNWGDQNLSMDPGVSSSGIIEHGFQTKVDLSTEEKNSNLSYELILHLNGSDRMMFAPLGEMTTVEIESTWPDPSFVGQFAPDEKEISDDGFVARWKVLHLNRPFPQQFQDATANVLNSNFGVNLFVAVDNYQKSMRSIKYAIMLISLTFLIFFFVQIFKGVSIHPIQYLIVGLALCLFYTLLISLTEHLSFNLSYMIAGVSTIGAIMFYIKGFFKNNKLTMIAGGALGLVYAFIFIVTREQDYALLIGSIGLFVILTMVMLVTRKIDWSKKTAVPLEEEV